MPEVEMTNQQKFEFRTRFRVQRTNELIEPIAAPVVTSSNPTVAPVRAIETGFEVSTVSGLTGEATINVSATVNAGRGEQTVSGTIGVRVSEAGGLEVVNVEFEIGPVVDR